MSVRGPVRLGLVHTVPALSPVFHDLVVGEAKGLDAEPIHIVDPWLLRAAMSSGVTRDVVDRLAAHVRHLASFEVAAVLVTCSSLGEATEDVGLRFRGTPPVVRVDQAMANRAVAEAGDGGRVVVLATVASTVEPTVRLIERSAKEAGLDVMVDVDVLAEAGRVRAAGDEERHDQLVADAVVRRARPERASVVVLAQASMARAGQDVAVKGAVPVVSSPVLAARHLLSAGAS